MINITVKGPNPGDFERHLKRALDEKLQGVARDLSRVTCPVHRQSARVKLVTSGSKQSFDVQGCCDKLIELVKKRLG